MILDIGSNRYYNSKKLIQGDIDFEHLKKEHKQEYNYNKPNYIVLDAINLPFKDNSINIVEGNCVPLCIYDDLNVIKKIIKEMYRVAKKRLVLRMCNPIKKKILNYIFSNYNVIKYTKFDYLENVSFIDSITIRKGVFYD